MNYWTFYSSLDKLPLQISQPGQIPRGKNLPGYFECNLVNFLIMGEAAAYDILMSGPGTKDN